jgi:hypothetical protein
MRIFKLNLPVLLLALIISSTHCFANQPPVTEPKDSDSVGESVSRANQHTVSANKVLDDPNMNPAQRLMILKLIPRLSTYTDSLQRL